MLKANLKPKSEHPLDPRPPNPLDMARAPLMAPNASVTELEAALDQAKSMCDRAEASLAALDQERAAVMIGGAAEVDAQLDALDQATSALTRRRALAGATEAALIERLATSRAAEAEKRKRAVYEKAAAGREALGVRLTDLIGRSSREWRKMLREFFELELAIRQVNSDLPHGAAAILSAERLRDATPSDPEIEVRELVLFVDKGGLIVAEEGAPGVSAQPRPDGLFDVSVGSAEWTGGAQWPRLAGHTCSREAFVDISTFKRRVSRPLDFARERNRHPCRARWRLRRLGAVRPVFASGRRPGRARPARITRAGLDGVHRPRLDKKDAPGCMAQGLNMTEQQGPGEQSKRDYQASLEQRYRDVYNSGACRPSAPRIDRAPERSALRKWQDAQAAGDLMRLRARVAALEREHDRLSDLVDEPCVHVLASPRPPPAAAPTKPTVSARRGGPMSTFLRPCFMKGLWI